MLDHDFHSDFDGRTDTPSQISGVDTVTSADTAETPSAPGDVQDTVIPEARMDAFIAISGERDYQERVYGYQGETSSADTILLIEEYLGRAKDAHARNEGAEIAHAVRKVAAIAVRAMEQLGVATRAEEDGPATGCGG